MFLSRQPPAYKIAKNTIIYWQTFLQITAKQNSVLLSQSNCCWNNITCNYIISQILHSSSIRKKTIFTDTWNLPVNIALKYGEQAAKTSLWAENFFFWPLYSNLIVTSQSIVFKRKSFMIVNVSEGYWFSSNLSILEMCLTLDQHQHRCCNKKLIFIVTKTCIFYLSLSYWFFC